MLHEVDAAAFKLRYCGRYESEYYICIYYGSAYYGSDYDMLVKENNQQRSEAKLLCVSFPVDEKNYP